VRRVRAFEWACITCHKLQTASFCIEDGVPFDSFREAEVKREGDRWDAEHRLQGHEVRPAKTYEYTEEDLWKALEREGL
jgi:hypothetical protein